MNYGFLILGELDRERLASALAEMLSLGIDAVDIGDEDDDDRNWDAPVSCTVSPLRGDFHWHLDIYVSNTLPSPPPEPAAAVWLAARLRTAIAYESVPYPPSAYWLVSPDGGRTRARIFEDDAVYRIDAVERSVTVLPDLPVAAQPEVIHSYPMPTPLTNRLRRELPGDEGVDKALNALAAWEAMVTRLIEGWPPDGWYPDEFYQQDLETREELAANLGTLPPPARQAIEQALGEVDRRFADATQDHTD